MICMTSASTDCILWLLALVHYNPVMHLNGYSGTLPLQLLHLLKKYTSGVAQEIRIELSRNLNKLNILHTVFGSMIQRTINWWLMGFQSSKPRIDF